MSQEQHPDLAAGAAILRSSKSLSIFRIRDMLRALLKEMPRMGIQMGGSRQLDIAFKKIISRSPLALHPLE